ncbi:MAG: DDE-type integrase/transposase/recombinase [Bacillota bacterium]
MEKQGGEAIYLMCIIDVYDRAIVDYHIGLSCEGKHAAQILQRALWKRQLFKTNCRPVIRSDNGPQFISNHFETACNQLSIERLRSSGAIENFARQLCGYKLLRLKCQGLPGI